MSLDGLRLPSCWLPQWDSQYLTVKEIRTRADATVPCPWPSKCLGRRCRPSLHRWWHRLPPWTRSRARRPTPRPEFFGGLGSEVSPARGLWCAACRAGPGKVVYACPHPSDGSEWRCAQSRGWIAVMWICIWSSALIGWLVTFTRTPSRRPAWRAAQLKSTTRWVCSRLIRTTYSLRTARAFAISATRTSSCGRRSSCRPLLGIAPHFPRIHHYSFNRWRTSELSPAVLRAASIGVSRASRCLGTGSLGTPGCRRGRPRGRGRSA